MEIYPQDLSPHMYRKLLSRRGSGVFSETEIDQACEFLVYWQSLPRAKKKPFVSSLLKTLNRKKSQSRNIVSYLLIAAGALSFPLWIHSESALTLSPFVLLALALIPMAQGNSPYIATMIQYGHKPVTEQEVTALLPSPAKICHSYWELLATTHQDANVSDEVQKYTQTALEAIEGALEQCSAMMAVNSIVESPGDLIRQADEADREAGAESDEVTGASLRRQADALRASANMSIRLATIRRRGEVLEREIGAQIQAMHVSLTQYQQYGHQSLEELLALAHNIQKVAAEAAANADAHEELRAVIAPVDEPITLQTLTQ